MYTTWHIIEAWWMYFTLNFFSEILLPSRLLQMWRVYPVRGRQTIIFVLTYKKFLRLTLRRMINMPESISSKLIFNKIKIIFTSYWLYFSFHTRESKVFFHQKRFLSILVQMKPLILEIWSKGQFFNIASAIFCFEGFLV